jgi:hypothetical protein
MEPIAEACLVCCRYRLRVDVVGSLRRRREFGGVATRSPEDVRRRVIGYDHRVVAGSDEPGDNE